MSASFLGSTWTVATVCSNTGALQGNRKSIIEQGRKEGNQRKSRNGKGAWHSYFCFWGIYSFFQAQGGLYNSLCMALKPWSESKLLSASFLGTQPADKERVEFCHGVARVWRTFSLKKNQSKLKDPRSWHTAPLTGKVPQCYRKRVYMCVHAHVHISSCKHPCYPMRVSYARDQEGCGRVDCRT